MITLMVPCRSENGLFAVSGQMLAMESVPQKGCKVIIWTQEGEREYMFVDVNESCYSTEGEVVVLAQPITLEPGDLDLLERAGLEPNMSAEIDRLIADLS